MPRRVRIVRVSLSYADGMMLHTAASGPVPALDELRLVVEQDGALTAVGATRVNIAYLSGIPPEDLVATCLDAARRIDWACTWTGLPAQMDAALPGLPAPARMLFEMAAADGAARAAGHSLAVHLGGPAATRMPSNQTLFRTDDATLLQRAEAYVARGFLDLKLRVGFGPFAEDLARLRLLRDRFGDRLRLSADANGQWSEAEAPGYLDRLAPLHLRYIEQPIPAGDWAAIARISRGAPMPVMLDESLCDMAAIEALIATRAAPMAHLKLAKLGGLDRLMQAGRALQQAGIAVMVGQMNEGAPSTLAAAHAAAALGVTDCELYGADGLASDPAGPLRYADGHLDLPPGPGLGLVRHGAGSPLWEATVPE